MPERPSPLPPACILNSEVKHDSVAHAPRHRGTLSPPEFGERFERQQVGLYRRHHEGEAERSAEGRPLARQGDCGELPGFPAHVRLLAAEDWQHR